MAARPTVKARLDRIEADALRHQWALNFRGRLPWRRCLAIGDAVACRNLRHLTTEERDIFFEFVARSTGVLPPHRSLNELRSNPTLKLEFIRRTQAGEAPQMVLFDIFSRHLTELATTMKTDADLVAEASQLTGEERRQER